MNANLVTIDHPDGSATQYGHLSTIDVKVGDVVAAGQVIARSGDTGYSQCIPHLHFARQYQGGVVTDSVPVYFVGYADREFHTGDFVTPPAAPCAGLPTGPKPQPAATATDAAAPATGAASSATRAARKKAEPVLGAFCARYSAAGLAVPQTFTRRDAQLSFDWRTEGPGGYWLDASNVGFSASWSGRFAFPSVGRYTISVISSGAVKVSIEGVAVIDRAIDPGQPVELTVSKNLGAGLHRVDVQYTTTSGHGVLKLGWGRLFADV